jgi:hypothetical protein
MHACTGTDTLQTVLPVHLQSVRERIDHGGRPGYGISSRSRLEAWNIPVPHIHIRTDFHGLRESAGLTAMDPYFP